MQLNRSELSHVDEFSYPVDLSLSLMHGQCPYMAGSTVKNGCGLAAAVAGLVAGSQLCINVPDPADDMRIHATR